VGARFSAPVQISPVAHPASCTMGTGSFPGGKEYLNKFNLLALMKSVVVDSYEYEWKFSLFRFSVSWKRCSSQTAKSMLTSSVGIMLFDCMALLVQGKRLYAKPWHKS